MATEFAKTLPLGRVADVHELSDVITFLATPAAGYINGAIIHVDGGRTRDLRADEMILVTTPADVRTRSHSAAPRAVPLSTAAARPVACAAPPSSS